MVTFTRKEYNLRDTGPAGGWIFYINEYAETDGWKYLEASPNDKGKDDWYYDTNKTHGTLTDIGEGYNNSYSISSHAAKLCLNYIRIYHGLTYDDWFLPSKDELDAMYVNLVSGTDQNEEIYTRISGFKNYNYWSSSEFNVSYVWSQNFGDGKQEHRSQLMDYYVHPVRAF